MRASSSKAVAAMCAAVAVSPKAAEVQSLDDVRRVLAELQETHKRLQRFDDMGKELVFAVQNIMTGGKPRPSNATAGEGRHRRRRFRG